MKKQETGMAWLRSRMEELGYSSLQQVAEDMDINRGNLYRYFALEVRPSIAMLPIFCTVLNANYEEMLQALEII